MYPSRYNFLAPNQANPSHLAQLEHVPDYRAGQIAHVHLQYLEAAVMAAKYYLACEAKCDAIDWTSSRIYCDEYCHSDRLAVQ